MCPVFLKPTLYVFENKYKWKEKWLTWTAQEARCPFNRPLHSVLKFEIKDSEKSGQVRNLLTMQWSFILGCKSVTPDDTVSGQKWKKTGLDLSCWPLVNAVIWLHFICLSCRPFAPKANGSSSSRNLQQPRSSFCSERGLVKKGRTGWLGCFWALLRIHWTKSLR